MQLYTKCIEYKQKLSSGENGLLNLKRNNAAAANVLKQVCILRSLNWIVLENFKHD